MAHRADMILYDAWPLRTLPLLSGEFLGLVKRIKRENPSWLTFIIWIGEKIGTLHLAYAHCLRLNEFSSQVEEDDSPRDIITKLYTIALNMAPTMISPQGLVTSVKSQLHRFIPAAHDRMLTHHSHEEHDPAIWLESLINLPNRGYDLGTRRQPDPLSPIDIQKAKPGPATTISATQGFLPLEQLVNALKTSD